MGRPWQVPIIIYSIYNPCLFFHLRLTNACTQSTRNTRGEVDSCCLWSGSKTTSNNGSTSKGLTKSISFPNVTKITAAYSSTSLHNYNYITWPNYVPQPDRHEVNVWMARIITAWTVCSRLAVWGLGPPLWRETTNSSRSGRLQRTGQLSGDQSEHERCSAHLAHMMGRLLTVHA